jgi:hypothetical protein
MHLSKLSKKFLPVRDEQARQAYTEQSPIAIPPKSLPRPTALQTKQSKKRLFEMVTLSEPFRDDGDRIKPPEKGYFSLVQQPRQGRHVRTLSEKSDSVFSFKQEAPYMEYREPIKRMTMYSTGLTTKDQVKQLKRNHRNSKSFAFV